MKDADQKEAGIDFAGMVEESQIEMVAVVHSGKEEKTQARQGDIAVVDRSVDY